MKKKEIGGVIFKCCFEFPLSHLLPREHRDLLAFFTSEPTVVEAFPRDQSSSCFVRPSLSPHFNN
jgi:hypothetical protein